MIELSIERIQKILHEETAKKEELNTILRGIYTRYMRMYEKYFHDIDALNDEKIAEFGKFHEETKALVRYYYMDIPMDICTDLKEFEHKYSDNLLGPGWHEFLFGLYEDFKEINESENKSGKLLKMEFAKYVLDNFYDAMNYVFRDGFGTDSQTSENVVTGITGLLFKEQE